MKTGTRVWAPRIGMGTVTAVMKGLIATVSWDNPYLVGETFSPPVPAQSVWHRSQLTVLQ